MCAFDLLRTATSRIVRHQCLAGSNSRFYVHSIRFAYVAARWVARSLTLLRGMELQVFFLVRLQRTASPTCKCSNSFSLLAAARFVRAPRKVFFFEGTGKKR